MSSLKPATSIANRRPKRQTGTTLVELVVFIVVVSVAVVGVLTLFGFVTGFSSDPLLQKQSIAIAESLLEEIELKNYSPGGYTGADRSRFDDVGDYAGYASSGIYTVDGTVIPELAAYSVSVAVEPNQSFGPPGLEVNAALIRVTVTDPEGKTTTLSGYRTDYGT